MSEAAFWIAYLAAFLGTLVLGMMFKRRLWLISIVMAACSAIGLATLAIWSGGELSDPWMPAGLLFNFSMSWFAAAVAIYIVKFVQL